MRTIQLSTLMISVICMMLLLAFGLSEGSFAVLGFYIGVLVLLWYGHKRSDRFSIWLSFVLSLVPILRFGLIMLVYIVNGVTC